MPVLSWTLRLLQHQGCSCGAWEMVETRLRGDPFLIRLLPTIRLSVVTAINSCPILVTGATGWIGAALWQRLLRRGDLVIGTDNLNTYCRTSTEAGAPQGD